MFGAIASLAAPLIGGLFNRGGDGGGGGGGGAPNAQLAQIRAAQQQNLAPYVTAGQATLPIQAGQYQNLVNQANPLGNYLGLANDPNAILSRFGAGFQQSPGYQYQVDQMTKASNNAAAQGGYIGSPQQQEYMAGQIGGLANQDYNQYLNQVMGLYGQGLQGMGNMYGQGLSGLQNIMSVGANAGSGSTNTLSDMLQKQAALSYSNAENSRRRNEAMWGGFGGALGQGLDIYGQRQGWGNPGRGGQGFFAPQT